MCKLRRGKYLGTPSLRMFMVIFKTKESCRPTKNVNNENISHRELFFGWDNCNDYIIILRLLFACLWDNQLKYSISFPVPKLYLQARYRIIVFIASYYPILGRLWETEINIFELDNSNNALSSSEALGCTSCHLLCLCIITIMYNS